MTATFSDLQSTLGDCLIDESLHLQVKQVGTQLSIVINRPNHTTDVNYQDVAETLMAKLRSLNLSDISSVKLYGRPVNTKQIEWQTSQPLTSEASNPAISKSMMTTATNSVSPQKIKTKFQAYLEQFSHYSNVISAASLIGLLLLLGFNTLAGQKTEEKKVVWEYQVKSIDDASFTEQMNRQGDLGWELVVARRAKDSGDTFAYECIFKRAKKLGNEAK